MFDRNNQLLFTAGNTSKPQHPDIIIEENERIVGVKCYHNGSKTDPNLHDFQFLIAKM